MYSQTVGSKSERGTGVANNDNKELMEFLGKQFEGIDKRFDGIEKQLKSEIAEAKEEMMRHTGVLIEGVQHKLELLVEGRMATHEKMEREKEENKREHDRLEKMTLINTSDISTLDRRVGRLEGKA